MLYFRRWVTYMNLDTMSGFHHESDTPYQTNDMRFVKTDPYHFMLIGGNTPNWAGTSTANWFRWNDANSRCFDSQKAKKCHSSKLQGGEGGSRYAVLTSQRSSSGSARHQSQDQELCRALCPPSTLVLLQLTKT